MRRMNLNVRRKKGGGGIVPQQLGASFEKVILTICNSLRNRGIAWIDKKATETGKDKKTGNLYYKKKSTVDFVGFEAGGRHVCFDAKNIRNKTHWTYCTRHQIQHLYDAWKSGCFSFLLISSGDNRIYKVVPDASWDGAEKVRIDFREHTEIAYNDLYDFLRY